MPVSGMGVEERKEMLVFFLAVVVVGTCLLIEMRALLVSPAAIAVFLQGECFRCVLKSCFAGYFHNSCSCMHGKCLHG